jgi:hypothetical protein
MFLSIQESNLVKGTKIIRRLENQITTTEFLESIIFQHFDSYLTYFQTKSFSLFSFLQRKSHNYQIPPDINFSGKDTDMTRTITENEILTKRQIIIDQNTSEKQ